jgi:beta-lactamase regulating signal transducer with metallopeptidase domain
MLVQLLEAAFRSFALGGAVWLILRFLRVHNPQVRMTAWTVVLMVSLSMPVLMHWATVTIPTVTILTQSSLPDAVIAPIPATTTARPTVQVTESPSEIVGLSLAAENSGAPARSGESSSAGPPLAAIDWPVLAMGLYLTAAGGLVLRLVIGLALTWRLKRGGRRISEDWAEGSDVRLSAGVATPVTFGTTILLPAECVDWSAMKRQAVMAHERSHVARGDFHILLLATLHRAVFWFSPFSWWLLNELAETAELISDDAAIEVLGDRPSYAEILLDVARSARPVSSGIAMARTHGALKRVEHILALDVPPPPRLDWSRRTLVVVSLVPLVAIATVSFSKESKLVKVPFAASERQPVDELAGNPLAAAAAAPPQLWMSRVFDPNADWKTVASPYERRPISASRHLELERRLSEAPLP